PKWTFWLVVGIGLLANSRPFEGLLFALPLAIGLLIWIIRTSSYVHILAPTMAMSVLLFAWMAYFNYRGTGNPAEMPYTANFQQYHFVRPFIGTGMKPFPHYNNYEMAALFSNWEGEPGKLARSEEHTSELQSLAYLVCR